MDLKIDSEFKKLIPPMKSEELQGLKDSILLNGYDSSYPIQIWDDVIIDGHNRYSICKEYNIEFTVSRKEFNNRREALNWIIDNQINRRNITDDQRSYLIGKRYNEEKKAVGENQYNRGASNLPSKKTAEKIAEQSKVSHQTVKNNEKFAEAIDIVAENTKISPHKFLTGEIKISKIDIRRLAEKPVELQKEIMEKVEKKEFPSIKSALKKYEEELDESRSKENEGNPNELAKKICDIIKKYKIKYNINTEFIRNSLEIVNKNINDTADE